MATVKRALMSTELSEFEKQLETLKGVYKKEGKAMAAENIEWTLRGFK